MADENKKNLNEQVSTDFWRHSIDGFAFFDENLCLRASNPAAERMLSMSFADCEGKSLQQLSPEAETSGRLALYEEVMQSGTSCSIDDIKVPINGKVHRLCVKAFKVGSGLGIIITDISRLVKRLEDALYNAEVQLHQSQKMEAIGRLAGGVAHDFNNILGAMTGYCEILLEDLEDVDPMREDLEQMLRSCDRASSLTRQLLAFSRKQIMEPRVIDLNAIVADMHKMLRRLISADIELVPLLAPSIDAVKMDPGQIHQIVMNLAVNAKDAMPRGGKLIIETKNVKLDESFTSKNVGAREGPHVLLSVSDTGSGMDNETLNRIFEPFFTTKEQGKGTGLGLSTVYGIVTQNDGYIAVTSELGKGTTFFIYLPSVTDELTYSPQPPLEESPELLSPKTVLVVEDEPMMRKLMSRLLKKAGYDVIEAGHGGEALLLCEQHEGKIDLLLTDIVMPQMGGHQLAERLSSIRPEVRVMYTSGYTDDAILQHGDFPEGTAFIQKPFTRRDFLAKVREVLEED